MENAKSMKLCLDLMHADKEEDVIAILKEADFWDNQDAWRYYGDYENNYNVIGNQMSRPDAALVEKIVNSIDARLMDECLVHGIDPESDKAPQSIKEAVSQFFEDNPNSPTAGLISEWEPDKRLEIAKQITFAATGLRTPGNPSFTISDCGEGQTPKKMPLTLLSLNRDNKLRIPFVQGKFNMGGTGVLKFCGKHNFQLILSRRNPEIVKGKIDDPSDFEWGFTIVRRENPERGRRSSSYTYLAPLRMNERPRVGDILHFDADALPIFPESNKAYIRDSKWGTLIKLYEYDAIGFKGNVIFRRGGLSSRIDLLLPSAALPIRLHECRKGFGGHEGSFANNVLGLNVRLRDVKQKNITENFPASSIITVAGETMKATIYAFEKDSAKSYRKNEGMVFTVNGQAHGHFTADFFTRPATNCSYMKDKLLVFVDCSDISGRAREDLFMNSRDRLSGGVLRKNIEKALEIMLKENQLLRDLKERLKRESRDERIADDKPLTDILNKILKKSPTLSQLFLKGTRISNPFKSFEVQSKETKYMGKKHPSYFKFKGKDSGYVFKRTCNVNVRARIQFETDVENDYFTREIIPGEFSLFILNGDKKVKLSDKFINLHKGIGTLNLELPANSNVDDQIVFEAEVNDSTLVEPFVNQFEINVIEESKQRQGIPGPRRQPPGMEPGKDRDKPMGIKLPRYTKLYKNPTDGQKGWDTEVMSPPMNEFSALRIIHDSDEEGEDNGKVYDFYINMDNIYLKNEQKNSPKNSKTLNACFLYGMILVGLALIHDHFQEEKSSRKDKKSEDDFFDADSNGGSIEKKVAEVSKAIGPILLPMIDNLGTFEYEFDLSGDVAGEFIG